MALGIIDNSLFQFLLTEVFSRFCVFFCFVTHFCSNVFQRQFFHEQQQYFLAIFTKGEEMLLVKPVFLHFFLLKLINLIRKINKGFHIAEFTGKLFALIQFLQPDIPANGINVGTERTGQFQLLVSDLFKYNDQAILKNIFCILDRKSVV